MAATNLPPAGNAAERLDGAALLEWLDSRQAEVERDHRDGWTGRTCYCDMPKPCVDRAYELAAIEGLRALLGERNAAAVQWGLNIPEHWLPGRQDTVTSCFDESQARENAGIVRKHGGVANIYRRAIGPWELVDGNETAPDACCTDAEACPDHHDDPDQDHDYGVL